jgi:hypothetical protein
VEEIVPNVIADIEFLLRGATSVAANA